MKRIHWNPKDFDVKKLGHFGFFRSKFKDSIWQAFLKNLNS